MVSIVVNLTLTTMLPMTITIMVIARRHGLVLASLGFEAPAMDVQARMTMSFKSTAGNGPADWREVAYNSALMMLGPA